MSVAPTSAFASLSPAEMQVLITRAGLVLNPGQMADLVLVWRQLAGLIAMLPRARPMADDLAIAFRLPPPVRTATAEPAPGGSSGAVARRAAPRPARPASSRARSAPEKRASGEASGTKRAPARPTAAKLAAGKSAGGKSFGAKPRRGKPAVSAPRAKSSRKPARPRR